MLKRYAMSKKSFIIFSDLDGSLLSYESYSWDEASFALGVLREKDIPLIFCSSKTKGEIMYYRKKLNNEHPFVTENGGAIFIPKDYRRFKVDYTRLEGDYWVIELGTSRRVLLKALDDIKNKKGLKIKGFSDMDVEEVSELTRLPPEVVSLAMERDYSEPFIVEGDPEPALREIENIGWRWTSGRRFFHINGDHDKGRAVRLLSDIYKNNTKDIDWVTVGLGDSLNDLPMLEIVDKAILLKDQQGAYDPKVRLLNLMYEEAGPKGWSKAILGLIQQ